MFDAGAPFLARKRMSRIYDFDRPSALVDQAVDGYDLADRPAQPLGRMPVDQGRRLERPDLVDADPQPDVAAQAAVVERALRADRISATPCTGIMRPKTERLNGATPRTRRWIYLCHSGARRVMSRARWPRIH
jgi:hypothetical protein